MLDDYFVYFMLNVCPEENFKSISDINFIRKCIVLRRIAME
jgi:hypothetical protein